VRTALEGDETKKSCVNVTQPSPGTSEKSSWVFQIHFAGAKTDQAPPLHNESSVRDPQPPCPNVRFAVPESPAVEVHGSPAVLAATTLVSRGPDLVLVIVPPEISSNEPPQAVRDPVLQPPTTPTAETETSWVPAVGDPTVSGPVDSSGSSVRGGTSPSSDEPSTPQWISIGEQFPLDDVNETRSGLPSLTMFARNAG
jgi:hypothetical protein